MEEKKRIKLYEVNVLFELSDETKGKIVDDPEEGFSHPDQIPGVDGTFHVGALNLIDATMVAQGYATEEFPDGFEILSVSEMQEIFLANWPLEDDPLDWDESTPPEELMTFTCTCGEEITLCNNSWQFYECPECEKIIDKNRIIESKGKFLFIDAD